MRSRPNPAMLLLRKFASSTPILEVPARWIHGHLSGRFRRDPTRLIARSIKRTDAMVVQIGSSDGVLGDPIFPLLARRPGWTCVFVEPVPPVFAKLREAHGPQSPHRYENAAINDGSEMVFYYLDPAAAEHGVGGGYDRQLGSFNREHIVRHLGERALPYVRSMAVRGLTLEDLLARHGIERIDLLHVDAEGHDWKIVRQLDLERFDPDVILFEHLHLQCGERQEAERVLATRYDIRDLGADLFCRRRRSIR